MTESHWSDMLADNPPDLPAPADDGASSDDLAGEPGWKRAQREDDKADEADRKDDERRIGR